MEPSIYRTCAERQLSVNVNIYLEVNVLPYSKRRTVRLVGRVLDESI